MKSHEKLIKTILPALLCVLVLLVAACGTGGSTTVNVTKAATNKQVFVLPEAGVADISTFDPALATDAYSLTALNMVFTGLVELDDNGNVAPYLASSWKISPDNMTYTFQLRSGLKFSDGTPLTATDVAYSINRALDPATKSGTGPYYLRYIKDATAFNSGKSQIKTLIGDSIKPDTNANTISITAAKPAARLAWLL